MKIMHVTPHLGGGVGRVLLNYLRRVSQGEDEHSLYCLDYANEKAKKDAESIAVPIYENMSRRHDVLSLIMGQADIVFIHWWNHPLLYEWLINGCHPASRVLLWSHVSGLSAPQLITEELAAFPDIFAVASPCSYKVPALDALDCHDKKMRLRLLFSCAGLEHIMSAEPKPHPDFRISYLGTVDYVKMHPDFINLCLNSGLDNAVFQVAGGPKHSEFCAELIARGISGRFDVLGPIDNITAFLSHSDVFGYPLNRQHYGTGEQTLIEAQAAGVPPVVLAGGAEEFVVEHEITGLVAKNELEYSRFLKVLATNDELRSSLSQKARLRARQRFSIESTVKTINDLFEELMDRPKTVKCWPDRSKHSAPSELFLHSQGRESSQSLFFEANKQPLKGTMLHKQTDQHRLLSTFNEACFSTTRGSVFHYRYFFPEDTVLDHWCQILSMYKDSSGKIDDRIPL